MQILKCLVPRINYFMYQQEFYLESKPDLVNSVQVIVGGIAAGMWAYQKHRQRTNVHIMALNLVGGVPLTPREKETMMDILQPPPPPRKWWWPLK